MTELNDGGKDELIKACFLSFGDDSKYTYIIYLRTVGIKKEFRLSQRQAIIKLIARKNKHKRLIKNWRLILPLNVGYKLA